MKDVFNIVKVSDINDVDCDKIIKKCFNKPNMINYYYPHIFMNREKIDKEELLKIFDKYVSGIKRDKSIEQTIKKYNILTNIIETLFLCVLSIEAIKNIQKFIYYNFSKDNNNIVDIINHIIQEKNITSLEQLLNDKIDNSHSVFIIEKMVESIKTNYSDENLEIKTIKQFQLLTNIQTYINKQKYNPYINKILNFNKNFIIRDYFYNCVINESHDNYINNILDLYQNMKNTCYDINDEYDWIIYFKKISESLNIIDQKEKIMKAIIRFNVVHKILNIDRNNVESNDTKKINLKINLLNNIQSIIESNKIDVIISNSYINMLKNNSSHDKLVHLENIIQYFATYNHLTKELIKIIIPKYFSKENNKYYFDTFNRLNKQCSNKLSIIDTIIEQQKKYSEDLKNTHVDNESKSIFDMNIISLFNIDHKYIENTNKDNQITNLSKYLKGYNVFTNKWFDNHFSKLKKIKISEYLSNGKLQINNTIINTNLIILNALYLFNNDKFEINKNVLVDHFDKDIVNDIILTLNYYKIIEVSNDILKLNTNFLATKQEIKIDIITKIEQNIKLDEKIETIIIDKSPIIECYIIKSIKTTKIHKDQLYDIVTKKCGEISKEIYDKCMKRLFEIDYYEIIDDYIVYVP
uniref:Uncharacterized protein n=1 Tax=viral metagenome TaxID=1070528 RepID=A0A6C0H0Z0_9ZZZZ